MAETSKKKPRKSKIVLRECLDIEDDTKSSAQMQNPAPEASQTLLPKLKNAIDNETYLENAPTPQFSIQVDVESCFYEEDSQNRDADTEEIDLDQLNEFLPSQEIIVSNEIILKELDKLSSSINYSDRKLQVEVRNFFGRYPVPHIPDPYEKMIQDVLNEWKVWYSQSKIRTTILAYKCNICSLGWWHLGPFEEHIKVHKEVTLSLDSFNHECCVVAAQGQWYEAICLCKIEGNCPKCLRSYEQHFWLKRDTMYYYCDGCNDKFSTCGSLFAHEGDCIRYEKIIFRNAVMTESMWKCDICDLICLTQERYDEHYILAHSVRSDLPTHLPSMKACVQCSIRYHTYALHVCANRVENIKCNFCSRKFQNRTLAEIHMRFTKKDHYCRICKRYLKSQCMEMEHLLKHSKNYLLAYKCCDCLDNVLLAAEHLLRDHKSKWHSKRFDKRRNFCTMIVPRSCMSSIWAGNVSVADMIIEKVQKKQMIDKSKTTTEAVEKIDTKEEISDDLDEILKHRNISQENDKEKIDKMCTDLKNNMLKRTFSNASQSKNDVLTAIEGVKNEDTNDSNLDEQIKQESFDDNYDPDDDIKETQNSVDALLCNVNIKETQDSVDALLCNVNIKETQNSVDALLCNVNIKDDVEIEEPKWDQVVIDDSDDGFTEGEKGQEANTQGSLLGNLNLAVVKKEPEFEDQNFEESDVASKSNIANIQITTDVTIKEEREDYVEYDEDTENNIKEEHDACLEELSKVFRASKDAGTLRLTGISLSEEIDIKCEPMDDQDDYEDDIIMLCNENTKFDVTVTAEDIKKENATTSETSKDFSSDMDFSQFEPEVKISNESSEADEVNLESVIPKTLIDRKDPKASNEEIETGETKIKYKKKLYRCKKCHFIGEHYKYQQHKSTICLRKKHTVKRHTIHHETAKSLWPDITCTKCDKTFVNLKLYFSHFPEHGLRKGQCPRCSKEFKDLSIHVTPHLKSHIKNSFMKLQLLKITSCVTSKSCGLFQCKMCPDKVEFKNFFTHWESHLDLNSQVEETPPLMPAPTESRESPVKDKDSPGPASNFQLPPDELKTALDQMVSPMEGRHAFEFHKKCFLCRRVFARRNDVKRHIIEHLLRDAQSRVPALVCQLCQFITNKPDAYKMHMRNHAALPVFKCEICNKWFSDSSNFAKHKKVHNVNVLSICDLCEKKFNSKQGLAKHMEMHASTEPLKCGQCERTFFTESAYKKHARSKHEKPRLSRYCRICLTRFSTMRSMWTHMWDAHKERRQKADCPLCGKPFRKYQDVRAHLRDVHKVLKMRMQPLHRAPRSTDEDDIESFLENHDEIDDGEDTFVIIDNNVA